MGESLNKPIKQSERVPYDENSTNGLIEFNNQYIPEELLPEIFLYLNHKNLLTCQLVCKRWQFILKEYVWRKKAEMEIKHSLPIDHYAPWTMFYMICKKKPLYRNLVKNHSGKDSFANWEILSNGGDKWIVESPPLGVPPLPADPVFEDRTECFVTSYGSAFKEQYIDLSKEGCTEYLMDHVKPVIKFSEWYSCRWDCAALYVSKVSLKGENATGLYEIDSKNYSVKLRDDKQNKWFIFQHEFRDYGKGVKKIRIEHGGKDLQFWAGHYGCKIAGSCVILELPED